VRQLLVLQQTNNKHHTQLRVVVLSKGGMKMTEKEIKDFLDEMKEYQAKIKSMSEDEAVESLIRIGILNSDGKTLTEHQKAS